MRTRSPLDHFPQLTAPPSSTNYMKKKGEDEEELPVFWCLLCVELTNSRNCGCGLTAACKLAEQNMSRCRAARTAELQVEPVFHVACNVVNVCGNSFGGLWEEAVKRIPAMCVLKVRCCVHQL